MVKKFICILGMIILAFTFNTKIFAQEEEQVEDVMDISLEDLLDVEITTAGKRAEKVADIPASVVLITRADIERYGYTTLDDILEHVPGVFGINQRDVTGLKYGIRGFWSATANNLIYLINGVRQEPISSDGATYMAQQIPPESIDRVEVIRGPMSVIYGTGAFFGVINIITNDPKETEGIVTASYGNEKTVKTTVRAAYKKDDLNIAFNAGFFDTAGPDVPYSDMTTVDLSDYTSNTTTGDRWGYNFKFFNLSSSFKGFYSNMTFNIQHRGLDIFFPSAGDGALAKRTYSSYSFGYRSNPEKKIAWDGRITYHKGSTQTDWDWFTPPGWLNLGGDANFREDVEVDLLAFFNPSSKLNLTTGLYYKRILHEQLITFMPYIDYSYRIGLLEPSDSRAFFVQADIAPSNNLKFVLGVRLDQTVDYTTYWQAFADNVMYEGSYAEDKIEVLPRVALIFKLNEKNIVKLLYGKAINHPSIYQTASQAAAGQPPLVPEFIQTFEFNYLAAFSDNFNVNTSIFYNKFDKLIVNEPYIDPDSGAWIGRNVNSGNMTTLGGELSIKARLFKGFLMELSGTYQKTDDKRTGYEDITVAYSPKILGYFKASYTFGGNSSLAVIGRYVGAMEPYYDITIADRIAASVDGYLVLNANLRLDNLFGQGYFLNVNLSNLLDEQYLYPSFTLNGNWANLGLVGEGRKLLVTLGKKF